MVMAVIIFWIVADRPLLDHNDILGQQDCSVVGPRSTILKDCHVINI